jgi:hypothetical protein
VALALLLLGEGVLLVLLEDFGVGVVCGEVSVGRKGEKEDQV